MPINLLLLITREDDFMQILPFFHVLKDCLTSLFTFFLFNLWSKWEDAAFVERSV